MPRDRNENAISLHVSGFKDNVRPSDLAELFETHGRIADVYIPKDYYTGKPRGFAYVQYTDEEDARRVFESGDEFTLEGRKLVVQYAQGKRKSPTQMRGQGGRDGGGGRRRSRSGDRHYRPSSRRYSRSRSRSPVRRRRDSRSPVRRGRSRSRTPPRRRSRSRTPPRRRSPSPRGRGRRSPSPRGRSISRDRRTRSRSFSPRRGGRYTPSPDRDHRMGNGGEPADAGSRPEHGEIMEQGPMGDY
ncbi:Serine/arginine-rich splicing factor 12 [Mortierella alpina]|nr:Serine/arginine-rich splicing factor 12 [Mortierella alpina]